LQRTLSKNIPISLCKNSNIDIFFQSHADEAPRQRSPRVENPGGVENNVFIPFPAGTLEPTYLIFAISTGGSDMANELKVEIDKVIDVKLKDGEDMNRVLRQASPKTLRRAARLTQIEEDERNERYEASTPKRKQKETTPLGSKMIDNPTLSIEDLERVKAKHAKTAKHKKIRSIQKYYEKLDEFVEAKTAPSEKMRKTMRETLSSLSTVVRNFTLKKKLKEERKRPALGWFGKIRKMFFK
jgi:selenocysteine-specific translation elongation factor